MMVGGRVSFWPMVSGREISVRYLERALHSNAPSASCRAPIFKILDVLESYEPPLSFKHQFCGAATKITCCYKKIRGAVAKSAEPLHMSTDRSIRDLLRMADHIHNSQSHCFVTNCSLEPYYSQ